MPASPDLLHHRELLGRLCQAAFETVRELMAIAAGDADHPRPGMVAVVHTSGDLLEWHPHVHAIASRGGWDRAGRWIPMPYLHTRAAEHLFRHKVIRFLNQKGLLSAERIELLLSWQQHTGFSAHNAVTVEPEDPHAVERLARYLLRPPLSLERMSFDGQQRVVHYRRKRPARFASAVKAFDPLDFLARLLMHVPEPRLHTVRYYGRYANVVRARSGDLTQENAGADAPAGAGAETDTVSAAERRRLRRLWGQMIRRIYEVDPLSCPHCGSEMRILSFLLDPPVVRRILDHLAQHRGAEARDPPLPQRLAS